MTKRTKKDLRLWDKGNGIIPFLTRSQKLAKDLMKKSGVRENIIESFEEGKIIKTNCINPLKITQEDVSERDLGVISELNQNGILVYHILFSYIMIGKKTEIQCEHEVSTYENVIPIKSYLCVPIDIFAESVATDEDVTNESNKEVIINEFIEHDILMANQGYLYAYTVSEADGSADFYNVGVNILNGELVRVS